MEPFRRPDSLNVNHCITVWARIVKRTQTYIPSIVQWFQRNGNGWLDSANNALIFQWQRMQLVSTTISLYIRCVWESLWKTHMHSHMHTSGAGQIPLQSAAPCRIDCKSGMRFSQCARTRTRNGEWYDAGRWYLCSPAGKSNDWHPYFTRRNVCKCQAVNLARISHFGFRRYRSTCRSCTHTRTRTSN